MGVVSALIIIAVFVAFRYGHRFFGRSEDRASAALVDENVRDDNVRNEVDTPAVIVPQPARRPEPKPKSFIIKPEPASQINPKAAEVTEEAIALLNGKSAGVIEARDRLNQALSLPMNPAQRNVIKKKLSELANEWLFSRSVFPQDKLCSRYKVEPGNLLSSIAREHKVPWEILMDVNKIKRPELLKAGEMIKLIHGPFHVRVQLSTFTMDLYLQDTYVCSYIVGIGRPGRETPTGMWRVKPGGKLISPNWTDPDTYKTYRSSDPDYPLGSRWIALEGISGDAEGRRGFAIHGTKKPEEIGTAGSRGCIRLYNGDVVRLYNMLTSGLSQVEVVK
jgi:LysM repeat protein